MEKWNISIFILITVYLLHRMIRNAKWTKEKELKKFEKESIIGPWHYSLRQNLVPLCIGIILILGWKELENGWFWLGFGFFLVAVGLNPFAGLALNKIQKVPDFEWKPPQENEVIKKVAKKRKSAILFTILLLFWFYTYAQNFI